MTMMDRVIFWFCTHTLAALVALLVYKRYFMQVCG
jgi:hypothetical protein